MNLKFHVGVSRKSYFKLFALTSRPNGLIDMLELFNNIVPCLVDRRNSLTKQ